MSSSATTGGTQHGQAATAPGGSFSCPKCHAPLPGQAAAAGSSPAAQSAWLAPLWLRLAILVLLLAALASPLLAVHYVRHQVLHNAAEAASDYLNRLRAKDPKAKELMTEHAEKQLIWMSLQSILQIDKAEFAITDTSLNGQLVNVEVTCVLKRDAKLPSLPVAVDENPRAKLVMDRDRDGQWRVDSVSLLPKKGTFQLPPNAPKTKVSPRGGA